MPTSSRRRLTLALSVGVMLLAGVMPASAAASQPSVRLITPRERVTMQRWEGEEQVWIDPGTLVAAHRGTFQIIATRPTWTGPIQLDQIIDGVAHRLPDGLASSFFGLDGFFRIVVKDRHGDTLLVSRRSFCPQGTDVRVNADGPLTATFPRNCWGGPFTRGMVWGIDRGWALRTFEWDPIVFDGPDGRYDVSITITRRYRQLFSIAMDQAKSQVQVRVETGGDGCPECPFDEPADGGHDHDHDSPRFGHEHDARPDTGGRPVKYPTRGPLGDAPLDPSPPMDAMPDLQSLPAWNITLNQSGRRERIEFAATVWNAGPAPLLVEGFRRGGAEVMDAFQYFLRDGEVVGRARAGELKYHRANHNHWHFLQFARYSLWDAEMDQVVVSRKQAFCLAPTDAIDLTVPGAEWKPGENGLGTACGSYDPNAVWTRETLQSGWGDTYYQVTGTSLDVTGLPNGIYYVAVEANPERLLHETDTDNNLELRKIRLGGTPGDRTLRVFPWNGIDA